MLKNKILIFLILGVFFVSNAQAVLVSKTGSMSPYLTSLNGQFYDLNSQIIVRIPFTALYNVKDINSYDFYGGCFISQSGLKPTGAMHVRVYKYETDNPTSGDYQVIQTTNIYNTSCADYGVPVKVNMISVYNIENEDPSIKGIAFGFYADDAYNTDGYNYQIDYSKTLSNGNKLFETFTNTMLSYSSSMSLVNTPTQTETDIYSADNNLIYTSKMNLYGTYIIPRDQPTPIVTPNTDPLPCDDCDTSFPIGGGPGAFITPNWSQLVYCPDCVGNETINNIKELSINNGFCALLVKNGYGTINGCNNEDFIDFLYDFSNATFTIMFLLLGIKIYMIYKR